MLGPARDVDLANAGPLQPLGERLGHLADERFALATLLRDLAGEGFVIFWFEMFEREILELPPELRHTEAMRERRIEVARLLGDALPLLGRKPVERPHVVQAIGQLHDDDARVLRDRQQQLAIALDLPLLRRSAGRQLGDLGQAVDDRGDLLSELAPRRPRA